MLRFQESVGQKKCSARTRQVHEIYLFQSLQIQWTLTLNSRIAAQSLVSFIRTVHHKNLQNVKIFWKIFYRNQP